MFLKLKIRVIIIKIIFVDQKTFKLIVNLDKSDITYNQFEFEVILL